jgi:hypothetical protein
MRLRTVARATVSVARARLGATAGAAELFGSAAGGRWQLGDINRNFLTVYFELSILLILIITPERSNQLG